MLRQSGSKMFQYALFAVLFCLFPVCASTGGNRQVSEPALLPLPVYLIDDPSAPADIRQRLSECLNDPAKFVRVEVAGNAALVIRMIPDKESGGYVASAEAGAEACLQWEHINAPITKDGLKVFTQNLQIVQRMHGLFALSRSLGGTVITQLSFYRAGVKFGQGTPSQEKHVLVEGKIWYLDREEPVEGFMTVTDAAEQAVILRATNTGTAGAYVYGLNITKNGKIIPFAPASGQDSQTGAGFVASGSTVEFGADTLILEEESEGILVLKSDKQLDLSELASPGFYMAYSASGRFLQDDIRSTW
jgi:hypothetical protein